MRYPQRPDVIRSRRCCHRSPQPGPTPCPSSRSDQYQLRFHDEASREDRMKLARASMKRFPLKASVAMFCLLYSAGLVASQTTSGVVSGRIVDSTGAVIPGATVTLINENTGAPR